MNNRHPWQLKKWKSQGLFWSYHLNSTAHFANLAQFWGKWAGLTVLFSWYVAPKRHTGFLFFQLSWVPNIHFMWNPLLPVPPHFWGIIFSLSHSENYDTLFGVSHYIVSLHCIEISLCWCHDLPMALCADCLIVTVYILGQ